MLQHEGFFSIRVSAELRPERHPDAILPFALKPDAIVPEIRKWISSHWMVSGELLKDVVIEPPKAYLVPFYVFTVEAHSRCVADVPRLAEMFVLSP